MGGVAEALFVALLDGGQLWQPVFLELLTPPFARILHPRRAPLWITLISAQIVIGWLAILPAMRQFTECVQSFLPIALAGPLQDAA